MQDHGETHRHAIRRAALAGLAVLALAGPARASDDSAVCGPDGARMRLGKLGPLLAGTWQGEAPGLGYTTGVQKFPVTISYKNGRLYMSDGGHMTELRPVRGARKPLRYDFVKQRKLPKSAWATEITLQDVELTSGCKLTVAPQFSWTLGTGARSSNGIYSFVSANIGLGTMWNSAMGSREVLLTR